MSATHRSIRGLSHELPINEVRRRANRGGATGRRRPLAAADARQAGLSHQSGNALAAHCEPTVGQFSLNPRRPVGPSAPFVNRPHPLGESGVRLLPGRPRALQPGVEPLVETPSTRAIVVTRNSARCALMNRKTPSVPSPERTRPLLLPGSPALPAAGDSPGADGRNSSRSAVVLPSLRRPSSGPPGRPSSGSTALTARTRGLVGPAPPGPDQIHHLLPVLCWVPAPSSRHRGYLLFQE